MINDKTKQHEEVTHRKLSEPLGFWPKISDFCTSLIIFRGFQSLVRGHPPAWDFPPHLGHQLDILHASHEIQLPSKGIRSESSRIQNVFFARNLLVDELMIPSGYVKIAIENGH